MVVNGGNGEGSDNIEVADRAEEAEVCLELLRLRFDRDNEDVKLESMPIVRDLGMCGAWLRLGERGPRSRRVWGCAFCERCQIMIFPGTIASLNLPPSAAFDWAILVYWHIELALGTLEEQGSEFVKVKYSGLR